jgi:hypothetical protein
LIFGDLGRQSTDREEGEVDLRVWELRVPDDPQVSLDSPRRQPASAELTDDEIDRIYAQVGEPDPAAE